MKHSYFKQLFSIFIFLIFIVGIKNTVAQNVYIPDTAFLMPLLNNPAINTNADGFIQVSEANAYTGSIIVNGSGISDLTGIEAFALLVYLDCSNNNISSVNLSNNLALQFLQIEYNQLSSLDVTANLNLIQLECGNNQISSIDISSNINLENLEISFNQLTSIDVSANQNLTSLFLEQNALSSIDVSNLVGLQTLGIGGNLLTSLNVADNSNLIVLNCAGNQLINLNMQNGNNYNLVSFFATLNPNLTCVEVDDVTYMNANWATAIDATASYNTICGPCNVNIPDNNFKNVLLNNSSINTNSNSEIECSEAAAYTGFLMLAAYGINDLTGIEAFVNLTGLNCSANSLDTLDVTSNIALVDLRCVGNNLTGIEISYCPNLTKLYCWNNQITGINFADNPNIDSVDCGFNLITSLDFSDNPNLKYIECGDNSLSSLDLSANNQLTYIRCANNQLTSLNIQNGNNANLTFFSATGNPNGLCAQVDDPAMMNTNWPNSLPSASSFSANCGICTINIPDANFKAALLANAAINTNANQEIECSEAAAYTSFINVSNSNISDLTGIEAFTGITMLNCSVNQLSSLDLSANTALVNLNCTGNFISNLNISNCLSLEQLFCSVNQITELDLSNHIYLEQILCNENALISLNIQNGFNGNLTNFLATTNPDLECVAVDNVNDMLVNWPNAIDGIASYNLNCSVCTIFIPDANFKAALLANPYINTNSNQEVECTEAASFSGNIFVLNSNISDLTGIEAFPGVAQLNCSMNQLTSLDLSANTALTYVEAHSNQLVNLLLPSGNNLSEVIVSDNQLSSIDVSSNSYLSYLDCNNNNLSNLNVLSNSYVSYIFCNGNQITNLDFSNNSSLIQLGCANNNLNYLNIQNGNNGNLTSFDASNNPQLTCVQVDSVAAMNSNWPGAIDATASYSLACAGCTVTIPDLVFKNLLLSNLLINTNANQEIECLEAASYVGGIYVAGFGITDLTGIEAFTSITSLDCSDNQISNLDLSSNTALTEVICSSNLISNLNVSTNSQLQHLLCSNNQLITIDLSDLVSLTQLTCDNNLITSLDVAANVNLTHLFCSFNQLNILDVSQNYNLIGLICQYNPNLTFLNIQNGFNTNLTSFEAINNPNLTCVQVDDITFMTNVWSSAIDASATYSLACAACIVNIPDVNFKNELVSNLAINTNNDGEIQCAEAAAYTGYLNVQLSNISDLTGIAAFTAIDSLNCSSNQLTSLDLSSNISLIFIQCFGNQLSNLNINGLSSLKVLYCYLNEITSLDVSTNTDLITLNCNANLLTSLDVTTNTALTSLGCGSNLLSNIDVTNNPLLTSFGCNNNMITSLNLQSNPLISTLGFSQNQITDMDLSNLTLLDDLGANDNYLTYLNIQNGNNINLQDFDATGNPDLTCIQVDDVAFMNANFSSYIDTSASFSLMCAVNCPNIPIAFNANTTNIITSPMNVIFTNNTPNISNYNFVWYFGDGLTLASNAASVNHTYYFNGIYTVALVAIDINNGCSDTLVFNNYINCNSALAQSCNHTVNINPNGIINACMGSVVPLNSSTNLSNPIYQWNRNGVIISGASQDNYYADMNGNYTLRVINADGCAVNSSPTQINYSLQSSMAPTISSSGTANNCGNVNVTLTANGSFTNYLWSTGQTGNSITVTQGGSYTVTGQSPACDAVSLPTLISGSNAPVPPICMVTVDETINKNIIIWEKPVSLEIDSFLILREDINTPGIYNIISAQSYVDLSEFIDQNSDADARAYRYKLAVKDTCDGITIPSSEQRSMHLDVTQGNSLLARQLNWNVYQGQSQAFTHYLIYRETAPGNLNLVLIDSVPSTQTWYYDNTLTTIVDTNRAYMIAYRITNPCVSTRASNQICKSNVTSVEFVINGMKDLAEPVINFEIYPNPNKGNFVIQTQNPKNSDLKIYNLMGEKLFQTTINNSQTTIDLNGLSNGVYLVSISDKISHFTKKLVISK
jgi:Leucine-rich repeat (LRR) protein